VDVLNNENYCNLSRFIRDKFRETPCEKLNLEEIVTFLDLSVDAFGSLGEPPRAYLYQARRELEWYVNNRLRIPERKGCQEHKKIIDESIAGFDSTDSIITLNYDLVVDNTLYELSPKQIKPHEEKLEHGCLLDRMYSLLGRTVLWHGERASLYHRDKEPGFYLKLHGSVDWLYCPNATCGNHQLFFPNWLGSEEVHDKAGDLCSLCGSPLVNVIVPPTMHKTFEKYPKLGLLWSLAFQELSKADTIVIFGVSFAPSDYYLRWLFKKATYERDIRIYEYGRNIRIYEYGRNIRKLTIFDIDKDSSVCEEIERITGIKPIYKKTLYEFLK